MIFLYFHHSQDNHIKNKIYLYISYFLQIKCVILKDFNIENIFI